MCPDLSAPSGRKDRGQADRDRARALPPRSPRDDYLLGTSLLASGDPAAAEGALERSVAADARRFWAWFALGLCHHEQGRYAEAAGDFAPCPALVPRCPDLLRTGASRCCCPTRLVATPGPHYDREPRPPTQAAEGPRESGPRGPGTGAGRAALADLDRAARLGRAPDPGLLAAWAEALGRRGRAAEAAAGFDEAHRKRPGAPKTHLPRVFWRLPTDPLAARSDFETVLADDPPHARAHLGEALALRLSDPAAALGQADLAVESDPSLLDALQLRALLRARLGQASAVDDVDRLLRAPTPHRLYNAACALALLSRSTGDDGPIPRSLDLLRRALEAGFDPSIARADPDLDSLRVRPEFGRMLAGRGSPYSPPPR